MKFTYRLVYIIDSCIEKGIGRWGDFNYFYITDLEKFRDVLGDYKFNTLKRQLNYYEFTVNYKTVPIYFGRQGFTKDNYKTIPIIKRKQTESTQGSISRERRRIKAKIMREEENIQRQREEVQKEVQKEANVSLSMVIREESTDIDFWDLKSFGTDLSRGHSLSSSRCTSPIQERLDHIFSLDPDTPYLKI